MHPNTSVSSVNEIVISYSIVIIAMQIEYSSNFLKALISRAAAPTEESLNAKYTFKGTSPPITFARIDRPVNALQLCP